MSVDSVVQYAQARSGSYIDQHPPVMAWLWSLTDRIVPGPAGMLLVHLALQWGGLWAVAEGARRRGVRASWLIPVIGLLPFVANIAGVIWKDVGMADALLCAGGVLYLSQRLTPPWRVTAIAVAFVLIGYATMVRANAPAATLALACYAIAAALPRLRATRSIVGGIVLIALLLGAQQIIERKLLDAEPWRLSQLLMLFDLAGIACGGGVAVDIPQAYRAADYSPDVLCRSYSADQADRLFFFARSALHTSFDADAYRALRATWLASVVRHPGPYVAHRAHAFAGLLGLHRPNDDDRYLRQPFMQSNPWGFEFTPNALWRALDAAVIMLANSGVFAAGPWIALAIGVLAIAMRRAPRTGSFEVALLASALMYALPYFVISLAPNYRFIYWTVIATSVASLLVLLRTASPRHRSSRRRVNASAT